MRENPVKRAIVAGGVSIGTMVCEFATTNVARVAGQAGAEFVLYDLEHSGFGLERMRDVLTATNAAGVVPIVRAPDAVYDQVARLLDLGALAVMIPACESAEEARQFAAAGLFPPAGKRGFGLLYSDVWEQDGLAATIAKANEETLLIAQIETATGVDAVEEIAAVDGIDALWIGQFDLSVSLDAPGVFDSERYLEAFDAVLSAAAKHGKAVGMVCGSVDEGRQALAQGVRALAYSFDVWLYGEALEAGITQLRGESKARIT